MDVNKEVERLGQAVRRGDEDEAIIIDTTLALHERRLKEGLYSMPKEHAETMGFYFHEWLMSFVEQMIYVALITLAFTRIENELVAILLGIVGVVSLIGHFLERHKFIKFSNRDIIRMRKEKIIADNYKLQLNYIQNSRGEHTAFLEKALESRKDDSMELFTQFLGGNSTNTLQENEDENERPEDTEPPEDK